MCVSANGGYFTMEYSSFFNFFIIGVMTLVIRKKIHDQ